VVVAGAGEAGVVGATGVEAGAASDVLSVGAGAGGGSAEGAGAAVAGLEAGTVVAMGGGVVDSTGSAGCAGEAGAAEMGAVLVVTAVGAEAVGAFVERFAGRARGASGRPVTAACSLTGAGGGGVGCLWLQETVIKASDTSQRARFPFGP